MRYQNVMQLNRLLSKPSFFALRLRYVACCGVHLPDINSAPRFATRLALKQNTWFQKKSNKSDFRKLNLLSLIFFVSVSPAAFAATGMTPAPITPTTINQADSTQQYWQTVTVQAGDNLADIFKRLGLSQQQLQDILALKSINDALSNLSPNEQLHFLLTPDHTVQQINYPVSYIQSLQITREDAGYKAVVIQHAPAVQFKTLAGTVNSSFAKDAIKAHLTPKQVKEFMAIFNDEINFNRDVKRGDYFSIAYETYTSADKTGNGDIAAAKFINKGKTYCAIRFTDEKGRISYYTPEGLNMQRAFMRIPVTFYRRISSSYSLNRLDPVSRQFSHPHKGTDFAAPTGTPIRATGDGKIVFAGVKNGYGNTIVIAHNSRYKTLYAHMDHFANDIHSGMNIQTGQLIGYVGATGRVTGPHLHYEFLVNGTPNNPLTMILPRARTIAAACRQQFTAKAKSLLALLEPAQSIHLISNANAQSRNN